MIGFVVSGLTVMVGSIIMISMLKALATNDLDFEAKREKLLKLFNSSNKTINITTDLDTRFFGDDKIAESLKNAAGRGVKIKILYDPDGYKLTEISKLEELVNKGHIEAKEAKEPFEIGKVHHYMIIDERAARLETYHLPKAFGDGVSKGKIYNVPKVALYAEHKFNEQWGRSV